MLKQFLILSVKVHSLQHRSHFTQLQTRASTSLLNQDPAFTQLQTNILLSGTILKLVKFRFISTGTKLSRLTEIWQKIQSMIDKFLHLILRSEKNEVSVTN